MDELRSVVHRSVRRREQVIDTDYYTMPPPGMFVGEHTGFVVADPALVMALLDVAKHANALRNATPEYLFEAQDRLSDVLDRLEEMHRG